MATKITKVRLVRCPKCLKVLPELANLAVYQCGGCRTTLKAKRRNEDQEGESSETLNHKVEDKGLICSSQKTIISSIDACEQVECRESDKEESGSRSILNGITSSEELNSDEKEESSFVAGANEEADGNSETGSDFESPSSDIKGISRGSNLTSAAQKSLEEHVPSKFNSSSLSAELEMSEKIVRRYADLIGIRGAPEAVKSSDDKIISEDGIIPNKFSDQSEGSKPQADKSYNVYDGSVSSNDDSGDQVWDHHSHQSKRSICGSQSVEEITNTNGSHTREDTSANNRYHTDLEVQIQESPSSKLSVNEKCGPVVVGSVGLDQDELQEHTRCGMQVQKQENSHHAESHHPVQSWLGLEREEVIPKKIFDQKDFSDGNENGGPSKYRHDELLSSCFYPPKKLENVERNQIELLRKVDELRNQLNRSDAHSKKANDRLPSRINQQERQCAVHYNQNLPDQDVLRRCGAKYPRQPPGPYRPNTSTPHLSGFSQMPPVNVMHCRHHPNCSCSNAYREDWQCQCMMQPPNLCYSQGLCGAYSGQLCYSLYSSSPSSPERCLHSHYPLWSRDVHELPFEQINRDRNVDNFHHRDRRQRLKRHCRPIAGGAPFIVCYNCGKILHLPADSVSSKRSHQIQCGSCSKVLMFSLHKGNHMLPYSRNSAAPPPSEIDHGRASTSMKNSVSTLQANHYQQGDPLSYSEDVDSQYVKVAPLRVNLLSSGLNTLIIKVMQ
ncbi:hypothetical protein IFM89_005354 [Coptis chinensis]|uniref:Zinc-ribbon domain-containing protein n=1 Tax=Coptis chinensis TaxID=261450 RepID=A0A835LHL6_9MAGN|nr:hypothetical protein IFM89_005354 [Coptis chinensis]